MEAVLIALIVASPIAAILLALGIASPFIGGGIAIGRSPTAGDKIVAPLEGLRNLLTSLGIMGENITYPAKGATIALENYTTPFHLTSGDVDMGFGALTGPHVAGALVPVRDIVLASRVEKIALTGQFGGPFQLASGKSP